MKSQNIFCIIVIIILLVCMLTSCTQQESVAGNEVSTVEFSDLWLSSSYIQKNNNYIYYTAPYGGQIYKIEQNGNGKTEVEDLSAYSFIFNDGYLYYTKTNENNIYRYKIDDSRQTILIKKMTYFFNSKIVIMNGWLYYQDPYLELNMIDLDGLNSKYISDKAIDFCIDEEWIYFIDNFISAGQDFYNLYRMRVDGTEKETIIESCAAVDYNSGYVFYVDQSGTNMYKMKVDGSCNQKIIDCNIERWGLFKVIGDWIYFNESGDNQGLYKVDVNGNQLERITDYSQYDMVNVFDNWLVCLKQDYDSSEIIMIQVDDFYSTDKVIEEILLDILPEHTIYKYE